MSLIFDDTFQHEALNNSDERRVILFVDFVRPLPWPLAIVNRSLIFLFGLTPFVQDARRNLDAWEKKFAT